MKRVLFLFIILLSFGNSYAQLGSFAGSFARIGFGARGLSMGNALSSNIYGDVAGYYNPALAVFQEEGVVNLGYTFMSLDRKLNFVGFARKFNLPNQTSGGAGISLSWINSGVNDIDGRDGDGERTELYSTSDNQFYLGTGFLLSPKLAVGLGLKLYYSSLFTDVTANSIAFDAGAIYKAADNIAIGLTVRDLGAKYKWNTSNIYGTNGNTTEDKFPAILTLGGSYRLPKNTGSVSVELSQFFNPKSDSSTEKENNTVIRLGGEYKVSEYLTFRAGIDRLDFTADDMWGNTKPTAGIGLAKQISDNIMLGIDYAFQLEPYTHKPLQNIGVVFRFK